MDKKKCHYRTPPFFSLPSPHLPSSLFSPFPFPSIPSTCFPPLPNPFCGVPRPLNPARGQGSAVSPPVNPDARWILVQGAFSAENFACRDCETIFLWKCSSLTRLIVRLHAFACVVAHIGRLAYWYGIYQTMKKWWYGFKQNEEVLYHSMLSHFRQ